MTVTRVYWMFAAVIATSLLAVNLLVPFNVDNDLYQAMGHALVNYGRLPYTGTWDHNFPGIAYVHASSIVLFGNSELGFRILDTIVRIASAMLLYTIVARWLPHRAALLSVALYALAYLSGYVWLAGQRDTFAVFVLLAAWALTVRARGNRAALVVGVLVVGVLVGVATLLRPTYILPALALIPLYHARSMRTVWLAALGFFIPWIVCMTPYAFVHGGLNEFYLATVRFNLDVYQGSRLSWSFFESTAASHRTLLFFATIALPWIIWQRSAHTAQQLAPGERTAILIWTLGSIVAIAVMGKYFLYHYEPLVVVLAPLAAYAIDRLLALFKSPKLELALALVFVGILFGRQYPFGLVGGSASAPIGDIDSAYGNARIKAVAAYLSQKHAQSVELIGIDPGLRWRISAEPATRFTKLLPLMMARRDGSYTTYQLDWHREFVETLRAHPPQYVVISNGPASSLMFARKQPLAFLNSLEGFTPMLDSLFIRDTAFGGFILYRRAVA